MTSANDPFLAEIRQTFGRCVVTQKTHEKDAERKVRQSLWLTWTNVVVITVTLAATLVAFLIHGVAAQLVSIISAVVAFAFATAQLSFQPQREAAEHRSSAKAFLAIRDDFGRLIADEKCGSTPDELRNRRNVLADRLNDLYAHAPQTSPKAYAKACEVLAKNEQLAFSDEELDRMLPPQLR
ncbi:hypothetical protein GGC64_006005 [Mycobacterium sp. OAS707]|uniref:SLATT domain-containing protein n=1 Tax=Mycobacterium sp. OAS707 TaxID=2663822 RepID=UPI00178A0023|nr:SLATT domain-containing protein [Mycobacterium sp. OAS707]MBE1551918.1 hypothetical protein [Mycobacterium sp. OAS707]